MSQADSKPPRIVIYGCGQYGGHVARLAVEKGWPIVAAFNRPGPKVGQDLGNVIGLGREIGVIVQDCELGRYDELDADIGVVTQTNVLRVNLPAYRRLMNAGLNVACHGTESYYPWGSDPESAAEIDALARVKGVSFTGCGIWDMSRIWSGILIAGPCTELRSLFHSSITNAAGQLADRQQALQIGAGMTKAQFMASGLPQARPLLSYKTIPEQVLHALGYEITHCTTRIEPIVFDEPLECALMGGLIPPGICVGTRIVAEINTREAVTARTEIELRLFREGEVEHMFWSANGRPTSRIRVERDDSAHATAACLFNRLPDIVAAPPGITVLSQLGPLRSSAR